MLHPRYDPRDPGETPDLRVACFTVQDLYLLMGWEVESVSSGLRSDSYGPFSIQRISAMKEGCRKAFLVQY